MEHLFQRLANLLLRVYSSYVYIEEAEQASTDQANNVEPIVQRYHRIQRIFTSAREAICIQD